MHWAVYKVDPLLPKDSKNWTLLDYVRAGTKSLAVKNASELPIVLRGHEYLTTVPCKDWGDIKNAKRAGREREKVTLDCGEFLDRLYQLN